MREQSIIWTYYFSTHGWSCSSLGSVGFCLLLLLDDAAAAARALLLKNVEAMLSLHGSGVTALVSENNISLISQAN